MTPPTAQSDVQQRRPVVTVGEFDGLHVGHRALVAAALKLGDCRVLPTTAVVLDSPTRNQLLSSPEQRCVQLIQLGVAAVNTLTVPDISASDEVANEILDRMAPSLVVMACPTDGNHAMFDASIIESLRSSGLLVLEVPRQRGPDGAEISSNRVRQLIAARQLDRATALLGRPYSVTGPVVRGAQLGRTIGVLTANVDVAPRVLLPPNGVYAAEVTVRGQWWVAAVNVGLRPTVGHRQSPCVEAHLVGFDGDLCEHEITLHFKHFGRVPRGGVGGCAFPEAVSQVRGAAGKASSVVSPVMSATLAAAM